MSAVETLTKSRVRSWPNEPQRLVLQNITWKQYDALLRVFDDRHLRLTYDRGDLEIMTLSFEHERYKAILRRLIEALAEATGRPIAAFGSMTLRGENLGLEPDEGFYVAESPAALARKLRRRQPAPPDLVVEIDISHSSLDRLELYAALGVPEVWRFDGERLEVYLLEEDGRLHVHKESRLFPGFRLSRIGAFVKRGLRQDDGRLLRDFRSWLYTVVRELSS